MEAPPGFEPGQGEGGSIVQLDSQAKRYGGH